MVLTKDLLCKRKMETKTESTTTKQTQRNLFLSYVGSHMHFWTISSMAAFWILGLFFLDNSVQVLFLIQVRWFPLNILSQTLQLKFTVWPWETNSTQRIFGGASMLLVSHFTCCLLVWRLWMKIQNKNLKSDQSYPQTQLSSPETFSLWSLGHFKTAVLDWAV